MIISLALKNQFVLENARLKDERKYSGSLSYIWTSFIDLSHNLDIMGKDILQSNKMLASIVGKRNLSPLKKKLSSKNSFRSSCNISTLETVRKSMKKKFYNYV